ncbi:MAG: FAD-dependent tricarballylate dehydrogenase TcuA, partial [Pseudomonadota bacterium]
MTDRYDVLIAGGGNAALCAAISAARGGASVCLVEAAPKTMRGGNTRHTRNCRVAHDRGNGILTGPYPVEEYMEDLMRVTRGATDAELARMTLERSKALWDFLAENGVHFQPSLGGTLSLGRTNAFFMGGGRSMLNALYRSAEDLGVAVHYDTAVTALHLEDGVFLGADVTRGWDGAAPETRRIDARALVAAAGGFEANIDWLEEAWGPAARNFLIRGTPYNTGGLLKQMIAAGCRTTGAADQCHAVAVDGRAPKFDGGIVTRLDCVPFGVVLNAEGRRFYDEGEDFWPKRYAIWGRLVAAQPGQVGHVVIDAKSIDLFMPSVFPPETADTLEDLAARIGLPAGAVLDEIARFNAACVP